MRLIERERVTYFCCAPAHLIAMLNSPELARFDLGSLRMVVTGGASCPIEVIRAFRTHLRGHLLELYGMLETGFQSLDPPDRRPRSRLRHLWPGHPGGAVEDPRRARPGMPPGRGRRNPVARPVRHHRLLQQPRRQRALVHRGRLVPHRRPGHVRRQRPAAHRRATEGNDHPRRRQHLSARNRGSAVPAPRHHGRRGDRHPRCAPRRAHLRLRRAARRPHARLRRAWSASCAQKSPPTNSPSSSKSCPTCRAPPPEKSRRNRCAP